VGSPSTGRQSMMSSGMPSWKSCDRRRASSIGPAAAVLSPISAVAKHLPDSFVDGLGTPTVTTDPSEIPRSYQELLSIFRSRRNNEDEWPRLRKRTCLLRLEFDHVSLEAVRKR